MPAFVFIHGGFCRGRVWAETAAALEADGHPVEVIDLPGSRTKAAEPGDLQADIAAARRVPGRIGAEIVLVGRFGGGMVLTEFADHPAVQHSAYLTALWPQEAIDRRRARLGWVGAAAPKVVRAGRSGLVSPGEEYRWLCLGWRPSKSIATPPHGQTPAQDRTTGGPRRAPI